MRPTAICLSMILLLSLSLGIIRQLNRSGDLFGTLAFANIEDLSGKVYIVTGANAGVGKSTAMGLAKMNATVIMACRSVEKCERARAGILGELGSAGDAGGVLVCMRLDLGAFEVIEAFVEAFRERFERLDGLVNNAGVVTLSGEVTADGLGMMWGVNHFGVFKLTGGLLPMLLEAKGRIVVVASQGHTMGTVDFDDIDMSGKIYQNVSIVDAFKIYCSSKLGNILFTLELSKKLKDTGVTVNSLDPGYVASDMSRELPEFLTHIYAVIETILAKTSWEGAQTSLHLATSSALTHTTGLYFRNCAPSELTHPMLFDKKTAERLWTASEKLTNTVYNFPSST